jgi:hypothetical protein
MLKRVCLWVDVAKRIIVPRDAGTTAYFSTCGINGDNDFLSP